MGDRSEEGLEVCGVVNDCCRDCFESLIRVNVDCCSEGVELLVKLDVLEVFHGLGKVFFGDEWVGISGVGHCLDFVHYCFSYRCMCKIDRCVVGVCAIYISSVWYEVYAFPEYVC